MGRWAAAGLGLVAMGVACDGPTPSSDQSLLATIDTYHFCDMDPVVGVQLRARWSACAREEPGCEPPEVLVVEGDRYRCPATDPSHDLGVELVEGGRYRVEAVAERTAGEPLVECFVDPEGGGADLELPWSRLATEAPLRLVEHGPCPQ